MLLKNSEKPHLALVIPVLNEAKNILPVFKEISDFKNLFPPFEILVVDDGSQDESLAFLQEARRRYKLPMRIFKHPIPLGKSAALYTAISQAEAFWIATMDADGQDNPLFIPEFLKQAEILLKKGLSPMIVGERIKRRDYFSRRLATKIANKIRSTLLKDNCSDTAAPIKVFSKSFFLSLPQFEGLHRFLPAFMKMKKGHVEMMPVIHRPRLHGKSKYTNISRAFLGFFDLLGVYWFLKRNRNNRFFKEY
ncbi:glycosyltransferase family 2 protein [Acetobacteraceae bacterium]|nr:glycosyltransferase family 2 protein [Acetobacteraceae bacterium]